MKISIRQDWHPEYVISGHVILASAMVCGIFASPAFSGDFDHALTAGTANVNMRLRYETVDDSVNKNATALTLRTRLGYKTGGYHGFSAFGEFEDVRTVGGQNEYTPETTGFATVADPAVTQLNQVLMAYQGVPESTIRLGRQRIILDNARFVGNVGWRQNEQTFDALLVTTRILPDTRITYAFLDKVNGILSKFDADVSDYLMNVSFQRWKPVRISGYAYLLEDDNDSSKTNNTYGVSVSGKSGLGGRMKLLYKAEAAQQSTDKFDATYTFLEGGVKWMGVTAKLGYEVLGSDGGRYGFQTPLATKHAFNGWADKFLKTPTGGLQDAMFTVTGKLSGIKLLAVYHDYSADQGSANYGSEINLLAAKKFGKRYVLGFKYASYSADTLSKDTQKLWVWGQLMI